MSTAETITLVQKDVPKFLQCSDFFHSLNWSDPDSVAEVPKSCFKKSTIVTTLNELQNLLETMRFWGVNEIAESIYIFTIHNNQRTGLKKIMKEYRYEMPWLDIPFYLPENNAHKMIYATKTACPTLIRVLLNEGYRFTSDCALNAVYNNDWKTLELIGQQQKSLLDSRFRLGKEQQVSLVTIAASLGYAKCMEVLMELGCTTGRRTRRTACYAARGGHLECLQLCRRNGCCWDSQTANEAALHDHLPCLKYAIENECPHHLSTVLEYAQRGNSSECIDYLIERGALDLTNMQL